MLGALAKHLRMMGVDTSYCRGLSEEQAIETAVRESRTLLTRRTHILQSNPDSIAFLFIRDNDPHHQLLEVMDRYGPQIEGARPFSRCLRCNCTLMAVDRRKIEGLVPDYVYTTNTSFSRCPACSRIYWQGTHYVSMRERINKALHHS